jgi:hypothetical protein
MPEGVLPSIPLGARSSEPKHIRVPSSSVDMLQDKIKVFENSIAFVCTSSHSPRLASLYPPSPYICYTRNKCVCYLVIKTINDLIDDEWFMGDSGFLSYS